jgi:hypothetical protein
MVSNSEKFTYHGKILDRCVRTIRDAIGYNDLLDRTQIEEIVRYYNYTYHKAIDCAPVEMMNHPEWEWQYIRWCHEKLMHILSQYHNRGLTNYTQGNILLLHLDYSRTSQKFEKRRRHWNKVAIFIRYVRGNVEAVGIFAGRYGPEAKKVIVPIYYTRKVSNDIDELPDGVFNTFMNEKEEKMLRQWMRVHFKILVAEPMIRQHIPLINEFPIFDDTPAPQYDGSESDSEIDPP